MSVVLARPRRSRCSSTSRVEEAGSTARVDLDAFAIQNQFELNHPATGTGGGAHSTSRPPRPPS